MSSSADNDPLVSEAEIESTIALFYGRAREDALLGPIFRSAVPDAQWNEHIAKIIAFWRKVLRRQPGYEGNPMQVHVALDVLQQEHFERWLTLFEAAARETCRPPAADAFVERARLIGSSLQHGLDFFRARARAAG
ncbi:group III truncated hemoglobin [Thalassobaculum sp.]|uniref:group III truncated hemoglobin n=1 Tax=Thalassobaculum sp. TaxID=2022740 RepID=UPI0032EE1ED1